MSRIAEVRPHVLERPLEAPFETASATITTRSICLVEITLEDGLVGWGECLGPSRPNAAMVRAMRPALLGEDPLRIEPLWLTLYDRLRDQGQRGITVTALSGVDIALWDLKGKRFGAPIHALMGGAFRHEVRAYASGGYRGIGDDRPAALAAETADYVAEGFQAVKIKIGFGLEEDLAAIRATREAIGPEIQLMIDANHGYDAIEAVALGRAIADLDIDWFEEPVTPEDLDGYREVRRGQPIPVAAGETWHTRWGVRPALERRCVDIIQPDACAIGGLSEARRVAELASAFHIRVTPHVWGSGLAMAAALHYLAILPPAPPRRESREPIMELDRTPNPIRNAVLTRPIDHAGGAVAVPDGPGLGVEVDRRALAELAAPEI